MSHQHESPLNPNCNPSTTVTPQHLTYDDMIRQVQPCPDMRTWANEQSPLKALWESCDRPDWLLFWAAKIGLNAEVASAITALGRKLSLEQSEAVRERLIANGALWAGPWSPTEAHNFGVYFGWLCPAPISKAEALQMIRRCIPWEALEAAHYAKRANPTPKENP